MAFQSRLRNMLENLLTKTVEILPILGSKKQMVCEKVISLCQHSMGNPACDPFDEADSYKVDQHFSVFSFHTRSFTVRWLPNSRLPRCNSRI